jgi:nucleoside-diphosphate-sugar epimerase
LNLLITGGTGFIGSHLVKALCEKNRVVVIVRDFVPSSWLNEALTKCVGVRGDILDQNLIRRTLAEYKIERVIHCAAQAIVSTALKDPYGTFQINIQGTVCLLEACRQADVESVYVQSTDKVYGERMDATEEDPLVSTGIYETSKVAEDLISQAYMNTYGMKILIGRPCNVYGYDQASRIVSNTVRSCLKDEQPIIFAGENTVRQYIYVDDLLRAITFLMDKAKTGIFNIGTDDVLTQEEVVQRICKLFAFPPTPRTVKRDKPIKEIQRQTISWNKLRDLVWEPQYLFETGVKQTIKKYQEYGF